MLTDDFQAAFQALKSILEVYAPQPKVVSNKPRSYYLDTHHIMKNNKPMLFGAHSGKARRSVKHDPRNRTK